MAASDTPTIPSLDVQSTHAAPGGPSMHSKLMSWPPLSPPVKRARSTSTAAESVTEEVERLRTENFQLKVELDAMEAQLYAFHAPRSKSSHHVHKSSILPSGKLVRISNEEMAAMRAIFDLFDRDGTGFISAGDLKALHEKLGEPITDEEATDAVEDISGGKDIIDFEHFCLYWDGTHPSQRGGEEEKVAEGARRPSIGSVARSRIDDRERKRQWYQARFKFVKAKVSNPAVGKIYIRPMGAYPSLEYRVRFFFDDEAGKPVQISPWHDVPYKNPDGSYNMIVEIPKWSRRKFEIATGEEYNPIKQDVKNGTLREYNYGDMLFNYGAVPQTWENPEYISPETNTIGDNDPIDIVDVGTKMWTTGSIVAVKILGVLAMIDSGETDWKLIGINIEDPLAPLLNDIDDLAAHMPGAVEALHHWLRHYKMPALNEFAFEGKAQNREFAERLVEETHEEWEKLVEARGGRAVVGKA